MKVKHSLFTVVCALALVAAPAAGRALAAQDTAQAAVEARIHNDAALKDVQVSMSPAGVVTLTGTVATTAEKTRAARDARGRGVTRVDNRIVVNRATGTTGTADRVIDKAAAKTKTGLSKTKEGAEVAVDKTKSAASKATEKTKEGAAVVADKTKEGAKAAGNEIADAFILTAIKTKFVGEDTLKGSDINVDVDRHVVTLRGTVTTEAGRARALAIARGTNGADRVVDNLVIAPKK